MKPIEFPEQNFTYAKDQKEYLPLPCHREQVQPHRVISCWELTDEEVQDIIKNKHIWLSLMTFGHPLQPIDMATDKAHFFDIPAAEPEVENPFPRRNRRDKWTPAETAIHNALEVVEMAGAHILLTDAIIKLNEARELVADFVEQQ